MEKSKGNQEHEGKLLNEDSRSVRIFMAANKRDRIHIEAYNTYIIIIWGDSSANSGYDMLIFK